MAPESQSTKAAQQRRLVGLGRLELPTSRLSSARSNQLSYKPVISRPDVFARRYNRATTTGAGLVREEREMKTAVSRHGPDRPETIGPDVSKRSDRGREMR